MEFRMHLQVPDQDRVAQLTRAVELEGKEPPKEIKIFSRGKLETTKGDFTFSEKSATSVMAAAQDYGNAYPFDYGHAMMTGFALDPAEAGKAAGWFRPEVREGALYATAIEWTPRAAAMILAKEYRYISPAFQFGEDNEILELANVALTNMPATKRMTPLMASRQGEVPVFKSAIVFLGLPESASEAEVLAVLKAWKSSQDKVAELAGKIAGYEAAAKTAEVVALVAQGFASGQIAPSMLEWAKSQPPEALRAFLAVAVKLAPTKETKPPKDDDGTPGVAALSALELEMAKKLGRKPEEFAKGKAEAIAKGIIRA